MSYPVHCPKCHHPAQWMGCVGCGDDIGTLVCQKCGTVIPGISLSALQTPAPTTEPYTLSEEGVSCHET